MQTILSYWNIERRFKCFTILKTGAFNHALTPWWAKSEFFFSELMEVKKIIIFLIFLFSTPGRWHAQWGKGESFMCALNEAKFSKVI